MRRFSVGEAPGSGDPNAAQWEGGNWTGMAYTSRHSGRRIRRLIANAGFGNEAYYTNAVKCFPCDGETNREPTETEHKNCRPYLREELSAVSPLVVVPTGKHATRSILALEGKPVERFLSLVLTRINCPTLGVTVVPLLHPSYRDVWVSRLGYTNETYERAVAEVLSATVSE